MSLEEIDHRSYGMAGDGYGLDLHAAEVEDLTFADELAAILGDAVREAGEVLLGQREARARQVQHRGQHAGVVAVTVRERDSHGLASGTLGNDGAQRLVGIVRPVDTVGEVYDKGFILTDYQIDVRAVVEMRLVAFGIEGLASRIGGVVVLDVIDVVLDDGDGVRSDFDVIGTAAGGDDGRDYSSHEGFQDVPDIHIVKGLVSICGEQRQI